MNNLLRSKIERQGITLGQLKEAMLVYCNATNPSALRRMTKAVIAQHKAVKEAENIIGIK